METPIIGQQENRGDGFGSGMSRGGDWTNSRSAFDMGRSLDQSQLISLQAMYGAEDRLQGAATEQSSATTLSSYSYMRGVSRVGTGLPAFPRSCFVQSTQLSL